jgi:hypothetical protein
MSQLAYNERKVRALQKAYRDDRVVRAVLDYFATRDYAQRETEIESLANRIVSISRREILGVMKALQQLELGRVYQGRRGRKTRFVWAAPLNQVGLAAQGQLGAIDELEETNLHRISSSDAEHALRRYERVHRESSPPNLSPKVKATAAVSLTIDANLMSEKARTKLAELLTVLNEEDHGIVSATPDPVRGQPSREGGGRNPAA